MSLRFSGPAPEEDQLSAFLADREVLVIADDFEHLSGGSPPSIPPARAMPGAVPRIGRQGGSGLGGLQHRQAGDSLHMPASGQPSGDRAFLLVGEDGALRDIELELKRSFELLDSAPLDMPDRHRGLETVFEYSWSLFDDAGRQVDKPIKDDGQPSAKMPGKRPSTSVSTLSNWFSLGPPLDSGKWQQCSDAHH